MQTPDKLIPANILIADRHYRIKISPDDEEIIRGHVKLINEKILELKTAFPGKDMQDYVAMTLIWFATEKNNQFTSVTETNRLLDKLEQINQMIDTELK